VQKKACEKCQCTYLSEGKNLRGLSGDIAFVVWGRVAGVEGRVVSLENGPSVLRGSHLWVVVVQRKLRGSKVCVGGGPLLQAVEGQGGQSGQDEARSRSAQQSFEGSPW